MFKVEERGLSSHACRGGDGWLAVIMSALVLLAGGLPALGQLISVAPDDQTIFMFSGPEGGPFQPQTLTEWTLENTDVQDLAYTVSSNQPWLVISPSDGNLGGGFNNDVTVQAALNLTEAQALAAGLYSATVSFRNLANGAGDTTRTVQLQVAPANFSVSPAFVNTTANLNAGNPSDKVVTLSNGGLSDLNYSLTWDAHPWLIVSQDGGTVPGGGTSTFTLSFNTAGLAAGSYSAQIEIANTTNGAGSRTLPVSLIVKSREASTVTLRPDEDIEIAGPVGSLPTESQQSTINNDGEKSVRWNAIVSAPWISVSPSSGELAASDGFPGGLDERAITIRVNAAVQTLPPGSAAATATFQTITTNLITGEVTGVAFATRVVNVVANPVLTLSVPAVGGEVTTAPEGTDQGSTATTHRLNFPFGQVVVVTASPGDGYEFRGWAGDYPEDAQLVNPLILPMDASKSLGALIAPILRSLTLSFTGAGTGTIDMDPTGAEIENPLEARYTNGTSVRLLAEADAGSMFRGWSGNVPPGSELSNPINVLMDRERVISARFEPSIDFAVNVEGSGTVVVDPDLEVYSAGMTVTLTAVANEDFHFAGWGGAASGSTTPLVLTLTGDTVVTATFAAGSGEPGGEDPGDGTTAKLFVDIQGDGLVTPNGGNYVKGATVTVIATPTVSSKFVRWEQDALGTELTATVLMDRNRTVRAIFEAASGETPSPRPTPPSGGSTCGATGMIGLAGMFLGWISLAFMSRRY
jgi:hypothetical protein